MHLLPYSNEPIETFDTPAKTREMQSALRTCKGQFGNAYPLIIGGKKVASRDALISTNPSAPTEIVGYAAKATREHADAALETAWSAFESWRRWKQEDRSRVMLKAAEIMRRRKRELEAVLVYEIGKNYIEASGEVAEMIDFTEYYARQALRQSDGIESLNPWPGEENESFYIPLGAGLTISPWNFPMAIMTGMTMGPIVVGNTIVAKPAEDAVVSVAKVVDILHEAGLPDGVVNYLPGLGAEVGSYLVQHPRTRFINFTGNLDTGKQINEMAARVVGGQRWLKRVFLELGGKDAILVDESADLGTAAEGVVQSAFGYQGQKCSACSRLIVVSSVYDELLERVVSRTQKLTVDNSDKNPDLGPVCNATQDTKIRRYLEIGNHEGRLLTGGHRLDREGFFFEPTVYGDIPQRARIAQEEVFGPVLSAARVRDFDEGLAVVNETVYGLTGAFYSQRRDRIERARAEFHVGNLYFNRKCTGALVGVQPFGGFNLSGTNTKAGGPDYLLHFLQMKAVAERF